MTEVAITDPTATETIVARAARGDQAAFAQLVADHHAVMARVAFGIIGEAEAAADATQAAWAVAWRRLGSLRDASTIRAWLVAIAANQARDLVRQRRRRPIMDISAVAPQAAAGDPADGIPAVDVARAVARLDLDDRALLALRFAAGFDSTEIAAHMGMSASGVRSRLSRCLARLRTELDHV